MEQDQGAGVTVIRMLGRVGAGIALVAGAITPLAAHHSTAEFDYGKSVIISGTVKELQWTNPHSYVQVMVPRNGAVEQWSVEIGAPAINVRMGWRKTSVKAGDQVRLDIAPARDGRKFGTLRVLTFADGRRLEGVAIRVKGPPTIG
jgi:hypothetical protein